MVLWGPLIGNLVIERYSGDAPSEHGDDDGREETDTVLEPHLAKR